MKLIAVLILYCVSCSAYYDFCSGHNMRDILLRCVADNGVSYDDLSDLLLSHRAKSEKARCFRACIFLSCKYMTHDGLFYADTPQRLAELLNGGISSGTQHIEQAANYCVHKTRRYNHICDTTEAYVQCFIKKSQLPLLTHGIF